LSGTRGRTRLGLSDLLGGEAQPAWQLADREYGWKNLQTAQKSPIFVELTKTASLVK
jgi:hypothetical protein